MLVFLYKPQWSNESENEKKFYRYTRITETTRTAVRGESHGESGGALLGTDLYPSTARRLARTIRAFSVETFHRERIDDRRKEFRRHGYCFSGLPTFVFSEDIKPAIIIGPSDENIVWLVSQARKFAAVIHQTAGLSPGGCLLLCWHSRKCWICNTSRLE